MRRHEFPGALDGAMVAGPLSAYSQQPKERMGGRVPVAGLIVLFCLMGLGFIDPAVIAQESWGSIAGAWRWT